MATVLVSATSNGSSGGALWGFVVLIGLWVVPPFAANRAGKRRGRRHMWILGLLLSWIGVWIVSRLSYKDAVAHPSVSHGNVLPSEAEPDPRPLAPQTKTCPACNGDVSVEARFCRHCGHLFIQAATADR